jgi:hypothetical protein
MVFHAFVAIMGATKKMDTYGVNVKCAHASKDTYN